MAVMRRETDPGELEPLVEPLSQREIEILALIADHLSKQEILWVRHRIQPEGGKQAVLRIPRDLQNAVRDDVIISFMPQEKDYVLYFPVNRMVDQPAFQIADPDFKVYPLAREHLPQLQRLCERCADFTQLVEGQAVSPGAAEALFQDAPPGKSLSDKLLFGIFDRQAALLGVLEGMRHYPDERTWWIGLLLLAPEARGRGLGRKTVDGFCDYVRSEQGKFIMLGVVEENQSAYQFWQQQGFEVLRQTEPRLFGNKVQTVYVMRRAMVVSACE